MSFINYPDIHDDGQGNVTIQKSDSNPANLKVTGNSSLGKTTVNSTADNLPFHITGLNGQFWFFSGGGQFDGAVIRGKLNGWGLVFTGNDRVRLENIGGDNRIATLQDLANITFMQNGGVRNGVIATGFNK